MSKRTAKVLLFISLAAIAGSAWYLTNTVRAVAANIHIPPHSALSGSAVAMLAAVGIGVALAELLE